MSDFIAYARRVVGRAWEDASNHWLGAISSLIGGVVFYMFSAHNDVAQWATDWNAYTVWVGLHIIWFTVRATWKLDQEKVAAIKFQQELYEKNVAAHTGTQADLERFRATEPVLDGTIVDIRGKCEGTGFDSDHKRYSASNQFEFSIRVTNLRPTMTTPKGMVVRPMPEPPGHVTEVTLLHKSISAIGVPLEHGREVLLSGCVVIEEWGPEEGRKVDFRNYDYFMIDSFGNEHKMKIEETAWKWQPKPFD